MLPVLHCYAPCVPGPMQRLVWRVVHEVQGCDSNPVSPLAYRYAPLSPYVFHMFLCSHVSHVPMYSSLHPSVPEVLLEEGEWLYELILQKTQPGTCYCSPYPV